MEFFNDLRGGLFLVLLVAEIGIVIFALVDAVARSAPAFVAAGKLTKPLWLLILAVSLAFQLVSLNPLGFLSLIPTVAGIVYLVDVRPAILQVTRGGSGNGPYG